MDNKKMLGVMIDCSRNAVMNVNSVKRFCDIIAKMGYNTLMLYTEDTYEVDNQPYFGYLRGRYSKEEIKEIDAYCLSKGIELIPCIQTLAHLNCIFKWWDAYEDIRDCDDILLIGEEKTDKLIEDIFSTISQCFTSKRIHIGMDEAYRVGLGKYLAKHGYQERFDIINGHLHKVCEKADKYGFKPMIWSDMFCKLALNSEDYYSEGDLDKIREKADLPENIELVYWDYYNKDYDKYVKMFKTNQAFGRKVLFAGGAWTWKGFAPDNKLSIETTIPAVKACKECAVDDIFITVWGDDGGECSRFAVLPSLFYAAELVKGNSDEESIKAKFKELVGIDFDSFALLNSMDSLGGKHKENPSKYLLYNDVFSGIMDYRLAGNENEYYADLKQKIDALGVTDEYKGVFAYLSALCDVLSVKSQLGDNTRKAYLSGDKKKLLEIAEKDYITAMERIKNFHKVYQNWWMSENKPHGFDMQDIRIGGALQRLESCKERIISYCKGELDSIPELEEQRLEGNTHTTWARTVTPNVISHVV